MRRITILSALLCLGLGTVHGAGEEKPTPQQNLGIPAEFADRALPSLVRINGGDTSQLDTQFAVSMVRAGGSRIVAAYVDSRAVSAPGGGGHFTGWALSTNNGVTWTDKGVLPDSPMGDGGIPQMAYDQANNRVYLVTVPLADVDALPVFVSTDSGDTFTFLTDATSDDNGTFNYQDAPSIAVDNSGGASQGNVYIAWRSIPGTGLGGVRVISSTTMGASWSAGVQVDADGRMPSIAVGPDGALHLAYYRYSGGAGTVQHTRSTNFGSNFSLPEPITATVFNSENGDAVMKGGFRTFLQPRIAVSPIDPDYVVVAYHRPAGISTSRLRVELQRTTDSGMNWANAHLTAAGIQDEYFPALCFSPDGERLMLSYYSRELDLANLRITKAANIGRLAAGDYVFGEPFLLLLFPTLPLVGEDPVIPGNFMGGPDSIVSAGERFQIAQAYNSHYNFGANRTGFDAFVSSVPLDGPGPILRLTDVNFLTASGDPFGDPLECIQSFLTITNYGNQASTEFESTPGPFAFPDQFIAHREGVTVSPIGPRQSVTLTDPVLHSTRPSVICPSSSDLYASVDDGTFSYHQYPLPFVIGSPSAAQTIATFAVSTAIPDNNGEGVSIPISVSGFNAEVTNVEVALHLTHTFTGDLTMVLVGPGGSPQVTLAARNGGAGNDFGTDCAGGRMVFSDAGAASISTGVPPFSGTFRPLEPLARFRGISGQGTWRLQVDDMAGIDTGSVQCVELRLRKLECAGSGGTGICGPYLEAVALSGTYDFLGGRTIDPSDCIATRIFLTNRGDEAATLVTAVVRCLTPGVTMVNSAITFNDIAALVTELSLEEVTFSVSPDVPCGTVLQFEVDASSDSMIWTSRFLATTGFGAGSVTAPAMGPVPILDNSTAVLPIEVMEVTERVSTISLRLHATHTFVGDLTGDLVAPDGRIVRLFNEHQSGSNDLGTDCPASSNDLVFSDLAARPFALLAHPFTGAVKPVQPLHIFSGMTPEEANGTWELRITDAAGGDVGAIQCATLVFDQTTCTPGQPCDGNMFTAVNFSASALPDLTGIDPNECNSVTVQLLNFGPIGRTGITGTLVSLSPELTVVDAGPVNFTDAASGVVGVPFSAFKVQSSAALDCNAPLLLQLLVESDQGPAVVPIQTAPGDGDIVVNYHATGPVMIPDLGQATLSLPVAAPPGTVAEVIVRLHIKHTFTRDLRAFLAAPNGTEIQLIERAGGDGDDFGTTCPASTDDTRLNDRAVLTLSAGVAPFAGEFRPFEPLSTFNGLSAADATGNWILRVTDNAGADTGSIECFNMTILYAVCNAGGSGPCPLPTASPSPSPSPSLSPTASASPTVSPTAAMASPTASATAATATATPTGTTAVPTASPTGTTAAPTASPTGATASPTVEPTGTAASPSPSSTSGPTPSPSVSPTAPESITRAVVLQILLGMLPFGGDANIDQVTDAADYIAAEE